jgi:hypothetical protein
MQIKDGNDQEPAPAEAILLIREAKLSRCIRAEDWASYIELKHAGFRALAYVEDGRTRLISRNGHEFRGVLVT